MLEILSIPLMGLNPAEKYFLVRLVDSYRQTLLIPFSADKLAERFEVKIPVARNVLNNFLLEEECIQKVRGDAVAPQGSQMAGRPPTNYRFQKEGLQKLLAKDPVAGATGKHQSLISDVLGGEGFKGLPYRHRLLLAVMLHYSDECGAVRGLGVSDLGALTGMKRDRCKKNLQELMEKEFIISHSPGATGAKLFGASAGIYVLALKRCYSKVGVLSQPAPWVWREYEVDPQAIDYGRVLSQTAAVVARQREHLDRQAKRLEVEEGERRVQKSSLYYRACNRMAGILDSVSHKAGCRIDEATLLTFFSPQKGGADRRLLQIKLEQYACSIFAEGLELFPPAEHPLDGPVFRQVLDDVVPKSAKQHQDSSRTPSTVAYEAVAKIIYSCAYKLAVDLFYQAHSSDATQPLPKKCAIVIVPREEGRRLRRIVVAQKR